LCELLTWKDIQTGYGALHGRALAKGLPRAAATSQFGIFPNSRIILFFEESHCFPAMVWRNFFGALP
jgi:hypothetical protein